MSGNLQTDPCIDKDVSAFLMKLRAIFRHPLVRRILPDRHSERTRNGELANILTELADRRRKIGVAIFERAIARGELSAGLDIENALRLPAMLYWEIVVLGNPLAVKKWSSGAKILLFFSNTAGEPCQRLFPVERLLSPPFLFASGTAFKRACVVFTVQFRIQVCCEMESQNVK